LSRLSNYVAHPTGFHLLTPVDATRGRACRRVREIALRLRALREDRGIATPDTVGLLGVTGAKLPRECGVRGGPDRAPVDAARGTLRGDTYRRGVLRVDTHGELAVGDPK
jgi:hypothetical protein